MRTDNHHRCTWPHKLNRSCKDHWSKGSVEMNKLSFAWSNINDSLFIKQLYQSTVCDWWTLFYFRMCSSPYSSDNHFFPCQLLKLKQMNLHLPGYWNGWKSGCRWICLSCYTCPMEAVHMTVFHWNREMQPGYKRNMKWFPNRQIHTRYPFGQVVSRFLWCWGKQTL